MGKRINFGKTAFIDLWQILDMENEGILEKRRARLFPSGNAESETSTVSIFLASLSAVKEYREELLYHLGQQKVKNKNIDVHTYTEIKGGNENNRPDGLIVITSGKRNPIIEWACFVEAKVKDNLLEEEQIERYVEYARDIGINDIITISNQLVTTPFDTPIKSKKTKFNLYHWSWTYLKVIAKRLLLIDIVEDQDHVFILKELRKYFDDNRSVVDYSNMGKIWKDSVNEIHTYEESQKIQNETLNYIINSCKQVEKSVCLQLTDRTKHYVELVSRNKIKREDDLANMLQSKKRLTSTYMIDGNKQNLFSIDVCFRSRTIRCYSQYTFDKGKAHAQTTSLIKRLDLSGTTDRIKINAFYQRNKSKNNSQTLATLSKERERSEPYSILDKSLGDEVKYFEIEILDNANKSFAGSKNFINTLENSAEVFVNQVMDYLINQGKR